MTEKRFEYYEHKGADYILDTPNKSLDFIEMLGDCLEAEEIVDLLNFLNDENEKLKQEKNEIQKWVKNKISYLEKKYEFGQTEYKGCPMHNIQFGINILKELQKYWEEQEND